MNFHCCHHCGKASTRSVEESLGAAFAHLRGEGWILKTPILLTGKADWMLFCSEECRKVGMAAYKQANGVTEEQEADAKRIVNELREEIPEMARQAAERTEQFANFLKKIAKK